MLQNWSPALNPRVQLKINITHPADSGNCSKVGRKTVTYLSSLVNNSERIKKFEKKS